MILKEVTEVPVEALPIAAFREHLRLGTGFSDVGAEDLALETYLRAALAAIEGRTSKALLARDFLLRLEGWRGDMAQPLPMAPVVAVSALRMVSVDGSVAVIPPERYRLVEDMARPRLAAVSGLLPPVPRGGVAEIAFTAGFGPAWSDLPRDLAQAVMLLAAQYFETRHEAAGAQADMPLGVLALIERWRTVRMIGGR